MSDRRTSTPGNYARDWQRSIEDRLYRLENGGPTAGTLGLGTKVTLGDGIEFPAVSIEIESDGAGGVNVVFSNLKTGSTSVVNLP